MNDEKTPKSSGATGAQKATEAATVTQAQLLELVAAAQSACTNVKASETGAQDVLAQLREILSDAKAEADKISEATPKLAAAISEVEAKRSGVATKAQQVDEAQTRATSIRTDLDALLVSAKQTHAETESLKQSLDAAKVAATQGNADILSIKATAEANAKAVDAALDASKAANATAKRLADKAATVEQRIKDYETKLDELNAQCNEQLEAIKSLLPGATSAGLASAFDKRRQTFLNPRKRWQATFIVSVVILAVIAFLSMLEIYLHASAMTTRQILVLWLSRVPVAAALVWLAMHASRESALAKRLEEDYGFKASVASSFQGFQEQMQTVGSAASANEPLKTLCDATLAAIANPPGRIYDKHALIVSPTSELLKAAHAFVEAAKAAKLPIGH